MGKIIAIINQKGGVGKTTTAVNLSAALGQLGCRVLLADLDPQGNATSGVGINKREVKVSSYHVLMEESGAAEAILPTRFKGLSILPSNIDLAGAEIELVEKENRAKSLRAALLRVKEDYDFIFIDCPPSLGLITVNALTASDSILIPIQCEYYALEGLTQLMQTVRTVKRLYNSSIAVEGVLLTMYDSRLNLTNQVVGEIKKYFADKVFRSTVPRSVRISEAPSYGEPICYYDKANRGTLAYQRVAEELLERFELDPKRKLSTFSKGMKKQVSVLLGLCTNTEYLLCDETFDGLDPVMRQAVKSLLAAEILNRKFTPVLASHSLREIEDICDHVGLLHRGGILFAKDVDEMKLDIHKVQCVIPDPVQEAAFLQALPVLHYEKRGSLLTVIVRGTRAELEQKLLEQQPLFSEILPLTLEEIFISETEVAGYDVRNLIY